MQRTAVRAGAALRSRATRTQGGWLRRARGGMGEQAAGPAGAAAAAARAAGGEAEAEAKNSGYRFFESIGSPRYHVAPMVDQSELPFRILCRRHGATAAYTPMLHARLFLESEKYRAEHFTTLGGDAAAAASGGAAGDRPLFVQFCANDPDILLGAARLVQPFCDAVDINLGCPQRIAKKGRYGAYLMDDIETVEAMVRKLHENLEVPVTCKVRIFPELDRTLEYVRRIERAGCQLLAVHGRTREMRRARDFRADWDAIRAVKQALSIPVLANGDIRNLDDIERCLEYTGCDGVLSAEPLLANPALFDAGVWAATKAMGEGALDENGMAPLQCCELLREYLAICRAHPVPFRMVRAHAHKIMGSWFRELTDLRDELNRTSAARDSGKEYEDALDAIDRVAARASERIAAVVAGGRSRPAAAPRDKKRDAAEQQAAREEAIRQQNEEAEALRALDADAQRDGDDDAGDKRARLAGAALAG